MDTRRIELPVQPRVRLFEEGATQAVSTVRYNADGGFLLSGGKDTILRLWNVKEETLVKKYTGASHPIGDAIFTPDSTTLLSCGAEKAVSVWDVSIGDVPTRKLRGHQAKVHSLALSTESCDVLASGSDDATVRIWDLRASRSTDAMQTLTAPKDAVTSVDFNGFTILAGSVDGYTRSYDIRTGTLITDCVGATIGSVVTSRDAKLRLISCLDSTLRLFDSASGAQIRSFKGHVNTSHRVASTFTPCERYVVTGSEVDGLVFFYSVLSGEVVHTLCHASASNRFAETKRDTAGVVVPTVAHHPTETQLASGGSDGVATLFW